MMPLDWPSSLPPPPSLPTFRAAVFRPFVASKLTTEQLLAFVLDSVHWNRQQRGQWSSPTPSVISPTTPPTSDPPTPPSSIPTLSRIRPRPLHSHQCPIPSSKPPMPLACYTLFQLTNSYWWAWALVVQMGRSPLPPLSSSPLPLPLPCTLFLFLRDSCSDSCCWLWTSCAWRSWSRWVALPHPSPSPPPPSPPPLPCSCSRDSCSDSCCWLWTSCAWRSWSRWVALPHPSPSPSPPLYLVPAPGTVAQTPAVDRGLRVLDGAGLGGSPSPIPPPPLLPPPLPLYLVPAPGTVAQTPAVDRGLRVLDGAGLGGLLSPRSFVCT